MRHRAISVGLRRILDLVSYPKRLVQDGEHVALDLRPHWWYFSRNILTAIPLLAVVVAVLQVGGDAGDYLGIVVAVLGLAWAGWLAVKYFEWAMTYFVVTDRRVIFRTGVLAKRGVEIPLDRISNINFAQGLWERVIGAGNLDIESAGRDGETHFDFVRHPDGVQHEIYRQMEADEQRRARLGHPDPTWTATAAGPSVPEQIEQLARLRAQGHITDEDFERKKAQLLDRM